MRSAEPGISAKDVAVIGAMILATLAVAGSLFLHSGLAVLPSAIVGLALFLLMASSYAVLERSYNARGFAAQAEQIGRDVQAMAKRADSIDALAAQCGELQKMSGRLEFLEIQVGDGPSLEDLASRVTRLETYVRETGNLEIRLGGMRDAIDIETRAEDNKIRAEIAVIETLVKQLAEEVAAISGRTMLALPAPQARSDTRSRSELLQADWSAPAPAEGFAVFPAGPPSAEEVAIFQRDLDSEMLEVVRRSIEGNKIELYLQPVMTLPGRKTRYYEAFTRLRTDAGDLIMPKDYLPVAEPAGMMPFIDNVMLFRSVQVLKRLADRRTDRGMFCNLSIHSLMDPEFFPEFVSFMEQNQSLADSLFFELGQSVVSGLGPMEHEHLESLSRLGFRFSLDQVVNLDIDFQALHDRGFRFIKIDARIFCHGMAEVGAQIHAADMRSYLNRFGLELVIEKIEHEADLVAIQNFGVKLGQGFLFASPRPVRPEIFRDPPERSAAA